MPTLEGISEPHKLVQIYLKGIVTRLMKLGDARQKLAGIKVEDQTDQQKQCPAQITP